MEPATDTTKAKKTLITRISWFLVGAVVNYLLISTPFKYLEANTALPKWAISSLSTAVGASFFFVWNYFINFRTDARKRDAFRRYLTVVVMNWIISSTLLTVFKHFNAHLRLNVGHYSIDLDIVAMQLCFGWLKFLIYHKWAFPVTKTPPTDASAVSEAPGLPEDQTKR